MWFSQKEAGKAGGQAVRAGTGQFGSLRQAPGYRKIWVFQYLPWGGVGQQDSAPDAGA